MVRSKLSIYYQNVRSIKNKSKLLEFNTNLYNSCDLPDVIALTETYLDPSIKSSELGLIGYTIFRDDRDAMLTGLTRGGGVLLAVKNHLTSCAVPMKSRNEQLYIKFSLPDLRIIIGAA